METSSPTALEFKILQDKIKELEKENETLKGNPKHGDKMLLRDIVLNNTGHEVLAATPEQMEEAKTQAILARDYQIDKNNNTFLNKDGKPRKRFNECGNDMESVLKKSSNGELKGLRKASGYPDLCNEIINYYLECKVADVDSIESSFRSFYLSTLNKITKSQAHILICFKHHDGKLSKDDEPIVIDLYNIELTLKCEWHTNNNEMYSNGLKEPDYTIEELDEIMKKDISKKAKNNKFSEISKRHKLQKVGRSCEQKYERLCEHHKKFMEIN
tara:strand:+ start:128 stop:943 length:816 start_codon:yes stop_codon:yes gene_type:complete